MVFAPLRPTKNYSSNTKKCLKTYFSPTIVLLSTLLSSVTAHVYTDSFPTFDEYDYSILDPEHVYGSPYGGFSRATRSRLAALPLYLPDLTDEAPSDDPLHMEVRDNEGRLFVCRVYHEDELDPDSIDESMFNTPKLRQIELVPMAEASDYAFQTSTMYTNSDATSAEHAARKEDVFENLLEVQDRLSALEGVCGQVHKGWWSYEVCFERVVTQFHIEIDPDKEEVRINDVISLGTFRKRIIEVELDATTPNELAEGRPEFGRVLDVYDAGGICPESKKPRKSFIHMQCCSEKTLRRHKGILHRDGLQLNADIAVVLDVNEDPESVCSYNVTVCTPLLCGDESDVAAPMTEFALETTQPNGQPKGNYTIHEILDRSLNKVCLLSGHGGWWTYELCYKGKIRQYHEVTGTRRNEMGALIMSKAVESEHILGKYDAQLEDVRSWGDEWSIVVNSTSENHIEGSGTYYEVEYSGGDLCDHSDVTDSAIVAGATGSGGVARSSSVRYFCGPRLDIAVNEDSTCHYMVEVSVPELCAHPLFREPVSKSQVVKCLPAY